MPPCKRRISILTLLPLVAQDSGFSPRITLIRQPRGKLVHSLARSHLLKHPPTATYHCKPCASSLALWAPISLDSGLTSVAGGCLCRRRFATFLCRMVPTPALQNDCLPPWAWQSSLWFQHHLTNVYHVDVSRASCIITGASNSLSEHIIYPERDAMDFHVALWCPMMFRSASEIVAVIDLACMFPE